GIGHEPSSLEPDGDVVLPSLAFLRLRAGDLDLEPIVRPEGPARLGNARQLVRVRARPGEPPSEAVGGAQKATVECVHPLRAPRVTGVGRSPRSPRARPRRRYRRASR